MKLRIVSDLHIDVNGDGNFGFRNKWNEVDALLIAGDIAGDYKREEKFLNGLASQTDKPIYAIAGNHLGYEYKRDVYTYVSEMFDMSPTDVGTKQWSIDYLKNNLPENVHYMDNDYIDLGDYILFAGTMYSDYKLYPNQALSIQAGNAWLNDFRYVYIKDKVIRRITPYDYIKYHAKFKRKLNKCLKETTKDIIVMTHFCPSIKSISDKYLKGNDIYLNASYASNMEKYILKNPRIKYWICGHVHNDNEYNIGDCKVIACPYGYHRNGEQKVQPRKWYGRILEL